MKKLFLVLVLTAVGFCSFAEFERNEKSTITIGMSVDEAILNFGKLYGKELTWHYRNCHVTEICPISKDACKVVLNGGSIVEYLKLGSVVYCRTTGCFYKVSDFDYNVVFLEPEK